ncbi:uncharacterized protein LOC114245508 [Bombyx mandarina]|uniref:TMC domain-containing protein n=3 Tax=Bombyx TaxID=7090 RepID=A0A8R2R151_BOMMO|nr:uncharacterized protein LOC114245508 [Bombyx mandarina]XP_037870178.1 uncharacterized protein LOC101739801 isoform X1 [Bombyx mori]
MTSSGVNLFHLPSETPITEVRFSPTGGDGSDDETYSASLSAVLRQRRASVRRSRKGRTRRPSSPFMNDESRPRRRSSVFTTSSGDTAISMEEVQQTIVTQEQIFENIHLHKEVLGSVKQQPLGMRRKLKIVHQAKTYIKRHEGQLQERLAQSKCTKDIYARFNILMAAKWQQVKREAANTSNLLIPWELRIKEIESHFGSVVASYFTFLRWLFWVNLVIGFILLVFVIVPEYLTADPLQDGERKIIMEDEIRNSTKLLTLWEFEGVLKYSPIFYGYYSNLERPQYRMPLAYFLTGLVVYIYSFVAILRKMAENSRMSKLSEKEDECIFSWKLFTGWDFMIGNTETAHNRIASIILGFKEALLEEAEKKKDLRNWRIISLRVFVNLCVIILLAVSAYAVVYVVTGSDNNQKVRSWWCENKTTIVVTGISITFPVFFELLGFLEHYHPRKQLRLQLARIMLLNLLNLYSLIFALFNKIDGMSKDLDSLQPKLDMNATAFPEILLNMTEVLATNMPSECFEERIICGSCNMEITFQFSIMNDTDSPLHIYKSKTKATRQERAIILKNIYANENESIKDETAIDEADAEYSTESQFSSSATENEYSISTDMQNGSETTVLESILLHRKQLQNLHKIILLIPPVVVNKPNQTSDIDYNEYEEAGSGSSSVENTKTITDTVSTESFLSSTESLETEITEEIKTIDFETTTSTSITSDVTYDPSTDSELTPSTPDGITDTTTSFDDVTSSTLDFSSKDMSDIITESVEIDTTTQVNKLIDDFTTNIYISTEPFTPTEISETTTYKDVENVYVYPNIDMVFNCTVNCGGLNVTQVTYISNFTIVERICYVTKCQYSTLNYLRDNQINMTIVDMVYTDQNNRKVYNLTKDTKKKLLKLCWETMFGQELVKLTMMDLVFVLLSALFMDFFRALFVRYMNRCWCWDLEKKFPEYGDFKIAENILHLINNQGMVWMGMFFSPGLVVLNVVKLMIMMYLRSWAVMTCNVPHEVVFRVSKSNNFYLALLLTMLFLCVLPVGYAIVWVKPSWHCGPFSEYDRISEILTKKIKKKLPTTLNFALQYIASPAIVIPLLVLLILIIYYLISLTNSLREANNDLKIQLRRERTEERRKMFQLADTRRRAGSSAMDNTPFARWKKALPSLPFSKSIDSDDRKASTGDEIILPSKKKKGGIFAKIVGMALDKKVDVEAVSEVDNMSPSLNNADDETDTDFHETLPKEVLKAKDITIVAHYDKAKENIVLAKRNDSEENKTTVNGKSLKVKNDNKTEKKAVFEKQMKDPQYGDIEKPEEGKAPEPYPKQTVAQREDMRICKKQTSESSTKSKQSDSIGSVIPVITISTTESDEETLSKIEKIEEKEKDKKTNKNNTDLKSLRRQSSVDSIQEIKLPKEKKQEEGHKFQYSL